MWHRLKYIIICETILVFLETHSLIMRLSSDILICWASNLCSLYDLISYLLIPFFIGEPADIPNVKTSIKNRTISLTGFNVVSHVPPLRAPAPATTLTPAAGASPTQIIGNL